MLPTCILASIASTSAADVVVFHNDNPDLTEVLFGYTTVPYNPTPLPFEMIDLTQDASAQPIRAPFPSHAVGFAGLEPLSSSVDFEVYVSVPETGDLPDTQIVVTPDLVPYISPSLPDGNFSAIAPVSFNAGGVVDSTSNWGSFAEIPNSGNSDILTLLMAHSFGSFEAYLVGQRFTFAVRFELNGTEHYGFAEFVTASGFPQFQPIRWGYETEPNTPLVIPASCLADVTMPFGELNFFDVVDFIAAYNGQQSSADLAAPFGQLNFFDIAEYISLFNAGCP